MAEQTRLTDAELKALREHTPGPWSVEQDFQGFYNVVCDSKGFDRYVIGCEGLYRTDGADGANARLISAAPELLSSHGRLLANFRLLLERKPVRDVEETIAEAEAAIAKATGEAP